MSRRIGPGTVVPAVAVLLALLAPTAARAGQPDTLGARLDTSGTWVAVISKATIPTHVVLTTEGDVHLSSTVFDMQPGERREVSYTGTGLGWVSARMTPLDPPPGASTGALEVRAWVRYVPPPAPTLPPLWPFVVAALAILAASFVIPARRRHA